MTRIVLALVFVLGCKGEDKKQKHGPSLTPVVANQLRAIAPECEVRATEGVRGTKELRLCSGPQAKMTMHFSAERNLIEIELGLWAATREEANLLVRQTFKGIVSDKALDALSERLGNTRSASVVVDGARVNAFVTKAPNENPRYTAVLAW